MINYGNHNIFNNVRYCMSKIHQITSNFQSPSNYKLEIITFETLLLHNSINEKIETYFIMTFQFWFNFNLYLYHFICFLFIVFNVFIYLLFIFRNTEFISSSICCKFVYQSDYVFELMILIHYMLCFLWEKFIAKFPILFCVFEPEIYLFV